MRLLDARGLLPPGDHHWTWSQFVTTFVDEAGEGREYRRRLTSSLHGVAVRLRAEQVTHVWIGGSFVTAKALPRDIDVVYEVPIRHPQAHWRDRELARLEQGRERRDAFKQRYRVDLRTSAAIVVRHGRPIPLVEAFRSTRPGHDDRSHTCGVVVLDLATVDPSLPEAGTPRP